jgi:hypothetical protein
LPARSERFPAGIVPCFWAREKTVTMSRRYRTEFDRRVAGR